MANVRLTNRRKYSILFTIPRTRKKHGQNNYIKHTTSNQESIYNKKYQKNQFMHKFINQSWHKYKNNT